jgi:hypothetical protein
MWKNSFKCLGLLRPVPQEERDIAIVRQKRGVVLNPPFLVFVDLVNSLF